MNMKDKNELKAFREDLKIALNAVEKKYDVIVTSKNIKYDDYKFNLDLLVERADVDVNKIEFEMLCNLYDFKPSDYNKTVNINGDDFKFIGFNKTKPKNNCRIIKLDTGKEYQTNSETIRRLIK